MSEVIYSDNNCPSQVEIWEQKLKIWPPEQSFQTKCQFSLAFFHIFSGNIPILRVFQGRFQVYQPFQGFFRVFRGFRGHWPPCLQSKKNDWFLYEMQH